MHNLVVLQNIYNVSPKKIYRMNRNPSKKN